MTGTALLPLLLAVVAPKVAVMPPRIVEAEGTEAGADPIAVHGAAWEGASSVSSVRVVARGDLLRLVARAAEIGIRCDPREPECAARIGAFGGLDFALVTAIDASGTAALTLVDCTDGRALRSVLAPLGADRDSWPAALHALARAALGVEDPPAQAVAPAPATSASPEVTATVATIEALPHVGVGVLVVGALVAAGAGAGAWAVAPTPESRARTTARQYNDAVTTGRALLVLSASGLAIAGAGAAVFLLLDDGAP